MYMLYNDCNQCPIQPAWLPSMWMWIKTILSIYLSKRKKEEFKSNVSEYCHKLRLKEHFPGKDNDESIERKKKKFILSRMRKDQN